MDGNDTMTQSTICDEISPKVSKESVPVEVELFEIWKKKTNRGEQKTMLNCCEGRGWCFWWFEGFGGVAILPVSIK